MSNESSTGPEGVDPEFAPDDLGTGGFGNDGVGTDLPGDAANDSARATPGGTADDSRTNEEVEETATGDSGDPGAGRQGPMVDDASIDWNALEGDGSSAPAGIPTDAEPTDGEAPAP